MRKGDGKMKYKAWNKEKRRWVKIYSLTFYYDDRVSISEESTIIGQDIDKDNVILVQSTECFDINGVELFEGDVFKSFCFDEDTNLFTHVIEKRLGSFGYDLGDCGFVYLSLNHNFNWNNECKSEYILKIGNIHENPELKPIP